MKKKLSLNRETIAALSKKDLTAIAGGFFTCTCATAEDRCVSGCGECYPNK